MNLVQNMKWIKKRDIIIVIGVLLFAGILFAGLWFVNRNIAPKAEIYYKQKLVKTIPMDGNKDETFQLSQNPNVSFHLYEDGSIGFEASDCPDKVCVRTGRLRNVGETAACLPNDCILKIVPAEKGMEGEVDIIG